MDQQTQQRVFADALSMHMKQHMGELTAILIETRAQLEVVRMQFQEAAQQLAEANTNLEKAQLDLAQLPTPAKEPSNGISENG